MKKNLILVLACLILFSSCRKRPSNCDNIWHAHITSNSPVTIGQTIEFGAPEVGGDRTYDWRGPHNYESHSPNINIPFAELENEGWYYLRLYAVNGDHCQKEDSVYIDVKPQQGTPSCSTTANQATFNNMAPSTYLNVKKMVDGLGNFVLQTIYPYQGGEITVYFHPHWLTAEPEDGIYTTQDLPVFGQLDYNYNKVFIQFPKDNLLWSTRIGSTVYVSHVNGKLQVTFCNLVMGAYNGYSFTTSISGSVLENR